MYAVYVRPDTDRYGSLVVQGLTVISTGPHETWETMIVIKQFVSSSVKSKLTNRPMIYRHNLCINFEPMSTL